MGVAAGFGIFGKGEWCEVEDVVFGVVGMQGVFTALWDQAWELLAHGSTTSSPWEMGMSKEPPSVLPLGILLMAPDLSICLCFLHSHPRPNFKPPGMGWPRAPVQVRSSSCWCCPAPGSLWPHWDELRAVKSCSLQRLIFGIGHIGALEFLESSGAFFLGAVGGILLGFGHPAVQK